MSNTIGLMAALGSEKPVYTNKESRKGKSNPKKKHKIKIAKRSRRINRSK